MACSPFCPRPSIVITCLPATSLTGVEQDRTACLFTITVQAPHRASPQPYLAPVSPRSERSTHNSARSSSTFTLAGLPLRVKEMVLSIVTAPDIHNHCIPARRAIGYDSDLCTSPTLPVIRTCRSEERR